MRTDGRATDELRSTRMGLGAQEFAEGSALIETGHARVTCAASGLDRGLSLAEKGHRATHLRPDEMS